MLSFHFAARSHVGMVRTNNQDSGYAGPHLLAMADGMGGHAGGDIASSTAIGALVDLDGEALSAGEATEALLDRIAVANADLGAAVRDDSSLEGMGTTLVALLRAGDRLVLAHIGDSRAFLARGGTVTQLTKDHSFVQSLVDEGRITEEEAISHPQRSLVTRVLTGEAGDEPDVVARQAQVGDRYLIASDGLTDYVARETVEELLLGEPDLDACADRLVELALRAGAPDNVTVVMGDVVDASRGRVVDQPAVVGAAAARPIGTRPLPVTPAEKAAELSRSASGDLVSSADGSDEMTLAEQGPTSRLGRVGRVLGVVLLVVVVLAGGSYAAWTWTQDQLYIAEDEGRVALFQGLNQTLGPVSLSHVETRTAISLDDLPDYYRRSIDEGISVEDRADAGRMLATLGVQAEACRYAEEQGLPCASVGPSWTRPTPTPSASGPTPSTPAPTSGASPGPPPKPGNSPTIPPTPAVSP